MRESRLLTTDQAAEILGVSPSFLEMDRHRGSAGVPFIRLGRKAVRYRREALEEWMRRQEVLPVPSPSLKPFRRPKARVALLPTRGLPVGRTIRSDFIRESAWQSMERRVEG